MSTDAEQTRNTDNDWGTVQLPTGKVIPRSEAKEITAMRYECPDPGHSGGYLQPGECRICRQQMVETEMMVRWAQK